MGNNCPDCLGTDRGCDCKRHDPDHVTHYACLTCRRERAAEELHLLFGTRGQFVYDWDHAKTDRAAWREYAQLVLDRADNRS